MADGIKTMTRNRRDMHDAANKRLNPKLASAGAIAPGQQKN